MPFSGPQFDELFTRLIDLTHPMTVLDIGPGSGKYGRIIRAKCEPYGPPVIGAVEAEESYIEHFNLGDFYDRIVVGRGSDVMRQQNAADLRWDLVILGDVLEHMPKSEGVDLLHYFVYRSKWLWLRWPVGYIQGAYGGVNAEAHISIWGRGDVESLRTGYVAASVGPAEAFIVQGYPLPANCFWPVVEACGAFHGVIEMEKPHG